MSGGGVATESKTMLKRCIDKNVMLTYATCTERLPAHRWSQGWKHRRRALTLGAHLVDEVRLKGGLVDEEGAAVACSGQGLAWPGVAAVDQAPAARVLQDKRPGVPTVLHRH